MIVKEQTASTDCPCSNKDFGREKRELLKNARMMMLKKNNTNKFYGT